MDLDIFWTQFAEDKLQDIFNYHKVKAGIKTSRKTVIQIIDRIIDLNKNPGMGPKEELLK